MLFLRKIMLAEILARKAWYLESLIQTLYKIDDRDKFLRQYRDIFSMTNSLCVPTSVSAGQPVSHWELSSVISAQFVLEQVFPSCLSFFGPIPLAALAPVLRPNQTISTIEMMLAPRQRPSIPPMLPTRLILRKESGLKPHVQHYYRRAWNLILSCAL